MNRRKYRYYSILLLFLTQYFFLQHTNAANGDPTKEQVGESKTGRNLRMPKYQFKESTNAMNDLLPFFAKEELIAFENKLLEHKKIKKRNH